MSAPNFSRIIEEVRQRPELWCKSHDRYANRALHRKIWRKISLKLNCDEVLVKKRWKHLKDQYRKELKKNSLLDDADQVNTWTYFKAMEFIKNDMMPLYARTEMPSQSPMRSNQSGSDEEDIDQSEADIAPATAEPSDKQIKQASRQMIKMTTLIEKHIKSCEGDARKDPDYLFLMSIMPSMKKLTDIQKFVFRGKINDWLLEAMTQNEFNVQCDPDSKYFLQTQLEVDCHEGH